MRYATRVLDEYKGPTILQQHDLKFGTTQLSRAEHVKTYLYKYEGSKIYVTVDKPDVTYRLEYDDLEKATGIYNSLVFLIPQFAMSYDMAYLIRTVLDVFTSGPKGLDSHK